MMTKTTSTLLLLLLLLKALWSVLSRARMTYRANVLARDGVIRIRSALPDGIRTGALSVAFQELGNCKQRSLGNINNKSNKRFEVALPLTPSVVAVVRRAWQPHREIWCRHVRCRDPRVVECSAMITFPGAKNQDWHHDNAYDSGEATLLSIGTALQDITDDMGPLEVVKGTHTSDDDVTDTNAAIKMTCHQDDIVAWNSSLYHRGSANASNAARVVILFTVASDGPLPDGSTYTLLDRYRDARGGFPRVSTILG